MTNVKPFDLSGQVAVITGSSRGIGRSAAEIMASLGAKVVVSSRKADTCEEVATAIGKAGGEALVIPCNISRKDEVEGLIDKTLKHWGRIDTLVCNAAVNPYFGPLAQIPDEAFDKIMSSNIKSNLWLCNRAIPAMAEKGGGSVVIVSSIGGLRGSNLFGAYGISKAADFQLARSLATEWGTRTCASTASPPASSRPISPALCGRTRRPRAAPRHHAAAPHRRARRDRRHRRLSRLQGRLVYDRVGDRGRRRRDDCLA